MWFWRSERAWQMLHFAQRPADPNRRAQPNESITFLLAWRMRGATSILANWKETKAPCLVLHLYFQTLTASHYRAVIIASSDWISVWFVLVVQISMSDHVSNSLLSLPSTKRDNRDPQATDANCRRWCEIAPLFAHARHVLIVLNFRSFIPAAFSRAQKRERGANSTPAGSPCDGTT